MSQFVKTFPGGKKTIQKEWTTGTAGTVGTTLTVPTGKLWLLLNITIQLTTDATAVNRYCHINARDSADVKKFNNYSDAVTASLTKQKFFTRGAGNVSDIVSELGMQLLEATEDVYIEISGGVAGDSYKYIVEYLEIDA